MREDYEHQVRSVCRVFGMLFALAVFCTIASIFDISPSITGFAAAASGERVEAAESVFALILILSEIAVVIFAIRARAGISSKMKSNISLGAFGMVCLIAGTIAHFLRETMVLPYLQTPENILFLAGFLLIAVASTLFTKTLEGYS